MWSSIFGALQTKGFHYMTLRKDSVNAELVWACSLQQACLRRRNLKTPYVLQCPYQVVGDTVFNKSLACSGTQIFITFSQEYSICTYSEPDPSSPHFYSLFLENQVHHCLTSMPSNFQTGPSIKVFQPPF